jgi:proline iminopeptidase
MRRYAWIAAVILLVVPECAVSSPSGDSEEELDLWPEIEPFRTDYLKVSDTHEIYYELCGNPDGKPVFVLHGGPGGSCSPYMRRFFNPAAFLIVLHDQRGAGRSRPYAEIRENTTLHLVEDIERLRRHLDLQKIIVFGGSWGATLGLAYAETYPDHVGGLVLRGVFTATREEIDYFYHGGSRTFFPDAYDELISSLPEPNRRPLPEYLLELIQDEDPAEPGTYSKAWARYEMKISSLRMPDERVSEILERFNPYAFALLENYYMANGCFLEEGQLYRDAGRLRDVPVVMVNGRYDGVCPPVTAHGLHQRLPNSKLIIAEEAGHWMGEKPIETALLRTMREFE